MTNRSKNNGEFRTKWLQITIYLYAANCCLTSVVPQRYANKINWLSEAG